MNLLLFFFDGVMEDMKRLGYFLTKSGKNTIAKLMLLSPQSVSLNNITVRVRNAIIIYRINTEILLSLISFIWFHKFRYKPAYIRIKAIPPVAMEPTIPMSEM